MKPAFQGKQFIFSSLLFNSTWTRQSPELQARKFLILRVPHGIRPNCRVMGLDFRFHLDEPKQELVYHVQTRLSSYKPP